MTPLGNINLKNNRKNCTYVNEAKLWTSISTSQKVLCFERYKRYKLNRQISNIAAHGEGEEADVPRACSMGFLFDHRSLKTGAPNVEKSFTCRQLAKLW